VTDRTEDVVGRYAATNLRAVILVEGVSDRLALETLASRRRIALPAYSISVVSMDGAGNIGRYLERFGPHGSGLTISGLYDAAEEPDVRRALESAGFGSARSRVETNRFGFYACDADLEDELIRALGADTVMEVIKARGELGSFRTLQKQPEWRGRPVEEQLRRFLGNASRKIECAPLLIQALELSEVPRPMDAVLAHSVAFSGAGRSPLNR
jgi:hypothetical protein